MVSEKNKQALIEANKKGAEIVIASGRSTNSVKNIANDLGICNYIICFHWIWCSHIFPSRAESFYEEKRGWCYGVCLSLAPVAGSGVSGVPAVPVYHHSAYLWPALLYAGSAADHEGAAEIEGGVPMDEEPGEKEGRKEEGKLEKSDEKAHERQQ